MQADKRTDGQTDRRTDGRTDGRTDRQTDRQTAVVDVCLTHHLTIEGISVLDEGFLTLGVGGLVRLSQIPAGLLSNLGLLEGLCEGSHRHVLPFALAPVVLLHHNSSFQSQNVYFDSEASSLHWKSKLRNAWGQ